MPFTCECDLEFNIPVPLNQALQEDEVSLGRLLLVSDLDYTFKLITSSPSPD